MASSFLSRSRSTSEALLRSRRGRPAGRAGGAAGIRRVSLAVRSVGLGPRASGSLFEFDYVWDLFHPPEKRRFGYYVLPILFRDRFVGRIEPKIDRSGGPVQVPGLWSRTTSPRRAEGFVDAMRYALRAYVRFAGARLSTGRRTWATRSASLRHDPDRNRDTFAGVVTCACIRFSSPAATPGLDFALACVFAVPVVPSARARKMSRSGGRVRRRAAGEALGSTSTSRSCRAVRRVASWVSPAETTQPCLVAQWES